MASGNPHPADNITDPRTVLLKGAARGVFLIAPLLVAQASMPHPENQ
jgi:hypothetical protein